MTELDADPTLLEVAKLSNAGLTIAQIQEKMELTKSKVETRDYSGNERACQCG
ncbi:MAG: hypothetical protein H0W50_05655 [Parachlamydiaceae bacterium]|nr:hypothetical protein [Parachlamydiaceae bacterium]